MATCLSCLMCAALTPILAPLVLSRGTWQVWHPGAALALWHGSLAAGLIALIGTAVSATTWAQAQGLRPDAGSAEGLAISAFIWGIMFTLAGCLAFVLAQSEAALRGQYAQCEKLARSLCHSDGRWDHGVRVAVLDTETPRAFAFYAPAPTVVVTQGLIDRLSAPEVDAVIEHEKAHLLQHHHWARLVTLVHSACTPRLGRERRSLECTPLLLELIADDAAIRRCGAATTASALEKLAAATGDGGMAVRAQRARNRYSSTSHRTELVPA